MFHQTAVPGFLSYSRLCNGARHLHGLMVSKSLVLSVVSCNSFMKQLSHIIDQDVASVELGLRVLGLHVI